MSRIIGPSNTATKIRVPISDTGHMAQISTANPEILISFHACACKFMHVHAKFIHVHAKFMRVHANSCVFLVTDHSVKYYAIPSNNSSITEKHVVEDDILFTNLLAGKGLMYSILSIQDIRISNAFNAIYVDTVNTNNIHIFAHNFLNI